MGSRTPLLLVALGVVLRIGFLHADSLWLDEAFSVQAALGHSAGDLWAGGADRLHPPLFYLILRGALHVGGVSEAVARLPSALASACGLGLVFLLARRLKPNGHLASTTIVLLALAPIDIWYAQEARMYALVTAAGLVFAIGLMMDSWLGAALVAGGLTAGLYLDFTMVPLSAALIGLWLVRWWHTGRSVRQVLRVLLGTTLAWGLFRPWWSGLTYVVNSLDGVTFFYNVRRIAGIEHLGGPIVTATLVLVVVGLMLLSSAVWNGLKRRRLRLWWTWACCGGFIFATAALAVPRAYSAKQILVTGWPFVVLVVAWTLTEDTPAGSVSGFASRAARLRLPLTVAVSLAAAIVTVATPRADWRGVVRYLNARTPARAVVRLDPPWNGIPYGFYQPVHPAVSGALPSDPGQDSEDVETWLVAERYGASPPTSPSEAWLDRHRRLIEAVRFSRLEVRRYAPPAARRD